MNFSSKLVTGLLGLFLLSEGSASLAASVAVDRASEGQLALNTFSTLALESTPASDLEGVRPFASAATFSGLTNLVAPTASFQQVSSVSPLDSETVFDDLPHSGQAPQHGNGRDLLAGLSLIGFLMVRRASLL